MEIALLASLAALTGAALWLARRKRGSFSNVLARVMRADATGRELRLLSRLHLTPQHSVHLIDTGDAVLLVGCSPQGLMELRETPRPASLKRTAA